MKQRVHHKLAGLFRAGFALIALTALLVAALPLTAAAATHGTSGNALIRNVVTVQYKDNNNNAMPTLYAAVDITVTTVAAAPTVFAFSPASGTTDGTGTQQAYDVTVITNSNGPGTIALTNAVDGSPTNISVSATTPTYAANSNTYGATIVDPTDANIGQNPSVAASGTITFTVPYDSTGNATTINTLTSAAGTTVYVYDGTAYYGPFTVSAVTNGVSNNPASYSSSTAAINAPTTGTIQLTNSTGSPIAIGTSGSKIAAGWQIVQARTFTTAVTVTQGAVADPTQPANWYTTVSATMSTGVTAPQVGSNQVETVAKLGKLVVSKYVRNVTTGTAGANPFTTAAGAAAPLSGVTYYASGVVSKPTDTLEYLIVVQNTGTGTVSSVQATDTVPAYTTMLEGSSYQNGAGGTVFALAERYNGTSWTSTANTLVAGGGATSNVAYGAATGTAAGAGLTFNLGQGSGASGGGALSAGDIVYIIFQTKVN